MQTITTTVDKIKPGDRFRFSRQRKFRTAIKVLDIDEFQSPLESQKGYMLIILDGCRQVIAPKNEEVVMPLFQNSIF